MSLEIQTLRQLCQQYRHAIILEETWPSAFTLAKALPRMEQSHGGLLLVGVRPDGTVVGVSREDLFGCQDRFARICERNFRFTTQTGSLRLGGKVVVFVIFNLVPAHRMPIDSFKTMLESCPA